METLYYSHCHADIADLFLAASNKGLVLAQFDRGEFPAKMPKATKYEWEESAKMLKPYTREFEEYFAGKRRKFTFPFDLRGTPFQLKCWNALLKIPYGETRSYADIARAIGHPNAFRAVGLANNHNRITIAVPCHRVLASDGTLCGYGGGLDLKRKLLELEGALSGTLAA
jgi:O-6-methylguanine DNA methyltransferase